MSQKSIINKPSSIDFIKANWDVMSNRKLADHLNVSIQTVRDKCYELGLYRMNLEYWTEAQIKLLKKMYHVCGDKELAELFQKKWPKKKGWTLKHIEKKRKYLNLKRTSEEIKNIKTRNKKRGCWLNTSTWDTRGTAPDGSIAVWRQHKGRSVFQAIKIDGKWVNHAQYLYIKTYGPVPEGHIIGFKDLNNQNVIPENLEAITRKEHQLRNIKKRNAVPDGLKQFQSALHQLNHIINLKKNVTKN